jgi:Xaa-Pro aminopeptidase
MRYDDIPSQLFSDRRDRFIKKMVPGSIAIFCSNDHMPRNGDQFYPFRQDSDLFALSGLDQPGTIIVLHRDTNRKSSKAIAFILPQDPEHQIWHGERYSLKKARDVSAIQSIYTVDQWEKIISKLLSSARTIYINTQNLNPSETSVLTQNDRIAVKLKQQYPHHTFLGAQNIIRTLSMIKHPVEIDLINKAISVTGRAFDHALHLIRPGMKEYELEAELNYVISKNGCQHAFEPIIASGPSACTLHYVRNDRIISKGDLVLIDFGAEYANMASDMTRTIPASGHFSKRQKDIYRSVMRVLEEVTVLMRPGMTMDHLNKETGKLIERELMRLKLVTKHDIRRQDPKAPLRRKYFMHGISHHLGYDVHDHSDRSTPFKPGMVLTCEPGLYLQEEGIGIRLENDILITRGKPKNLMAGIPIDPDEIESIMKH